MKNRGAVDDNHVKQFCYKYILIGDSLAQIR